MHHLLCVLQALREAGLTLNPTKCEWAVASCTYLGYIVGQGCRRPENCKVTAIMAFPVPTTKGAVRSFLGLMGYYRDIIPAYALHFIHLTEAT